MAKQQLKQSTRLLILAGYIAILFVASRMAFGRWIPPLSPNGFWFYIGLLSLLLSSQLVTPFYTPPASSITYAISAVIALLLVNDWEIWSSSERWVFLAALFYCSIVAVSAFVSILTRDKTGEFWQKVEESFRVASNKLGNSRAVYSAVILFAIYTFHRNSASETLFISLAWVVAIAIRPLEVIHELLRKFIEIWKQRHFPSVVGEVVAFQTPGIILIRQQGTENIPLGTPLLIRDPHAPPKVGIVLDYTGRDEGILLRALEQDIQIIPNDCLLRSKTLPDGAVVRLDNDPSVQQSEVVSDIVSRSKELIGIVAKDTSIERLYFEVVQDSDIEKDRLVETIVGGRSVLYQVIDGLTKEEIVHQKNKYGYARAQAQKIGRWDEQEKKFKHVAWIPKLNAPVFLKSTEDYIPDADVIGHFPKTNYTVSIKSIHDLVTHNTAILGILGVGKSMLGIELVERMITEGIKVICLDLTNQYAEHLKDFYDIPEEVKKLESIIKAGQKDQDQWNENPEQGGSLPNFLQAIEEDLKVFLSPETQTQLKIYNPAQLLATKQTSEPRSFQANNQWRRQAALWTATPVEITRIISEATLNILQQEGMAEDNLARVCLVYEEAHSLVPEWNSVATEGDKTATNGTARAILQGRKYGLGCLLITQRTANVTKTILNQCNTIFAMRSFDETGKKFLADYLGQDYAEKLPLLRERHAIFFGKASSCENPVSIRLNDRDDFRKVFREQHPPPDLAEESAGEENGNDGGNAVSESDIPL